MCFFGSRARKKEEQNPNSTLDLKLFYTFRSVHCRNQITSGNYKIIRKNQQGQDMWKQPRAQYFHTACYSGKRKHNISQHISEKFCYPRRRTLRSLALMRQEGGKALTKSLQGLYHSVICRFCQCLGVTNAAEIYFQVTKVEYSPKISQTIFSTLRTLPEYFPNHITQQNFRFVCFSGKNLCGHLMLTPAQALT